MNNYTIHTRHKKSAEEVMIFCNNTDKREIRITVGYRWGSVYANLTEEQYDILASLGEGLAVDMYDAFSADLNFLDDGWYEDIEFVGEFSEESQGRLRELWEENSFEALENEGWYQGETELWFIGPLDLELNDE